MDKNRERTDRFREVHVGTQKTNLELLKLQIAIKARELSKKQDKIYQCLICGFEGDSQEMGRHVIARHPGWEDYQNPVMDRISGTESPGSKFCACACVTDEDFESCDCRCHDEGRKAGVIPLFRVTKAKDKNLVVVDRDKLAKQIKALSGSSLGLCSDMIALCGVVQFTETVRRSDKRYWIPSYHGQVKSGEGETG